jgi:hypothetical protein
METAGYAIIKEGAKGISAIDIESFVGRVRVLEFADDGGVLVIDNKSTGIAMFEPKDVVSSFKCTMNGEVVCPPGLDILSRMVYATRATLRKGGYNHIVRELVIASSLHRGEFSDHVLWAKQ